MDAACAKQTGTGTCPVSPFASFSRFLSGPGIKIGIRQVMKLFFGRNVFRRK